jgi:hypothetical protein
MSPPMGLLDLPMELIMKIFKHIYNFHTFKAVLDVPKFSGESRASSLLRVSNTYFPN